MGCPIIEAVARTGRGSGWDPVAAAVGSGRDGTKGRRGEHGRAASPPLADERGWMVTAWGRRKRVSGRAPRPPWQVPVQRQPDDTTCGPTCLQAVYRYWGDERPLDEVIAQVRRLEGGGTLGVLLGCHALESGYRAVAYTYNLRVFDPTWFATGVDVRERLARRAATTRDERLRVACAAYLAFLERGGEVRYEDLRPQLLRELLVHGPILTGLSATYLYASMRETPTGQDNDIEGEPVGHFVVLTEFDARRNEVAVADPLDDNPRFGSAFYRVAVHRLICAILLGVVTYDATLLMIHPKRADL